MGNSALTDKILAYKYLPDFKMDDTIDWAGFSGESLHRLCGQGAGLAAKITDLIMNKELKLLRSTASPDSHLTNAIAETRLKN